MQKLKHDSPIPLYQQIKDILANKISNSVWQSGDIIPTEQELIEKFDVSRTTIRQAISELVYDGLLEKRQGRGTIVKSLKLTGTLSKLTGFAEEILDSGNVPNAKLLRAEVRDDLFVEKSKLELAEEEFVVSIHRIRFINDVPAAYEKTSWPKEIGEILMQEDLDKAKYYQVLENNDIYLTKAEEIISAVNATSYEADLLGLSPGTALLDMTRLSYGVNGLPIEYTRTKFKPDLYQYKAELHR